MTGSGYEKHFYFLFTCIALDRVSACSLIYTYGGVLFLTRYAWVEAG